MRDFFITSYCNKAHNIYSGRPYKHECRILPPEALRAERNGDHAKAIEILTSAPPEFVNPRQGVSKDKLPSADTCRERGWEAGTLLGCPEWMKSPRKVVEVRERDVILAAPKGSKDRVRSFPKTVFKHIPCTACDGRGWHVGECHPQETCGACDGLGYTKG